MAFNVTVTQSIKEGTTTLSETEVISVDGMNKITEIIADATTDGLVNLDIDISQLQAFGMRSSVAMTVKTNSSTVPDDTFTLAAGELVLWKTGDTAILTLDVTDLYVTNASGSAGTLTILVGTDPTL